MCDRSYGLNVSRLCAIPPHVIAKASIESENLRNTIESRSISLHRSFESDEVRARVDQQRVSLRSSKLSSSGRRNSVGFVFVFRDFQAEWSVSVASMVQYMKRLA